MLINIILARNIICPLKQNLANHCTFWLTELQKIDLNMTNILGKHLFTAGVLSRAVFPAMVTMKDYVDMIITSLPEANKKLHCI